MDDYPAAEAIPDPAATEFQYRELMQFLTDSRDMRKAATGSVKQGLCAAGGAIAGGFVLGPAGGLVGGIGGSIYGFLTADNYDGALQQIMALEQEQQAKLMTDVGGVLRAAGATAQQFDSPEAFRATLMEFAAQPAVRDQIWRSCIEASRT
ncbi:expressed unknown protein [Seminavis robusta]|uniref:Uncharacterized protein n=1 Tax=Seminavis robusta TaxID=568900 RepID=A0A9N8HN75_9STRA|nr:expressed unknown protein [Seminavis robusta]CAB9527327.1 expressed unknown protein [Seminavis robusta]|eukprot:Sro1977_g308970.1 n/a (151) ;mRNA; f:17487-17939